MEKTTRLTAEQRANLVAYLDGELDDVAHKEVERALASNPVARHEVEALQSTWELLDHLPRTTASAEFTRRTLASIEVQEHPQALAERAWFPRARRGAIFAGWAALLALSAVMGFVTTNRWIPTASDRLLAELPIIEKLGVYEAVGDVEFARDLRKTGLFYGNEPLDILPGGLTNDRKTHDERRRRIERMSLAERDDLRRNFETYRRMDRAERERYRSLHIALEEDKQVGARLLTTLAAYREWLDGLYAYERDAIRQESNAESRIRLIRQTHEQEAPDVPDDPSAGPAAGPFPGPGGRRGPMIELSSEDLDAVLRVAAEEMHADDERLASASPAERHLHQLVMVLKQLRSEPEDTRKGWPDDALATRMIEAIGDPKIRDGISQRPDAKVRRNILNFLVLNGVRKECEAEIVKHSPPPEQLEQFIAGLDEERRSRLDELEGHQRHMEALRMYFTAHPNPFVREMGELRRLRLALLPEDRPFGPRERAKRRDARPDGGRPPRFEPQDKGPPRRMRGF